MANRDKLINGMIFHFAGKCEECPYRDERKDGKCVATMLLDAFMLIQKMEDDIAELKEVKQDD